MGYGRGTFYFTNKYIFARQVHTLYISYFIEHNWGDEPDDCKLQSDKHQSHCYSYVVTSVVSIFTVD